MKLKYIYLKELHVLIEGGGCKILICRYLGGHSNHCVQMVKRSEVHVSPTSKNLFRIKFANERH